MDMHEGRYPWRSALSLNLHRDQAHISWAGKAQEENESVASTLSTDQVSPNCPEQSLSLVNWANEDLISLTKRLLSFDWSTPWSQSEEWLLKARSVLTYFIAHSSWFSYPISRTWQDVTGHDMYVYVSMYMGGWAHAWVCMCMGVYMHEWVCAWVCTGTWREICENGWLQLGVCWFPPRW
jgi:hypothetical protein